VTSFLSLATLALALPIQSADESQAARSLLEAAPASAELAIVVDDAAELWKNAQASGWAAVLRAPACAGIWEQVKASFEEEVLPLGNLSAAEVLGGVRSALFYFDGVSRGAHSGGLVVRIDPGNSALREKLRAALAALPERGMHEGRQVYSPEGLAESTALFEWRDGFALTGSDTREETLRCVSDLAQRLEQGSPEGSLAAILSDRRSTAKGTVELYLNLRALTARDRAYLDEEELRLWEGFGMDGLGFMSIHGTLGSGVQCEVLTRIDVPASGLFARWAACARPAPIELARFAPADAIEVAVLGFDAASAWRALRERVSSASPKGAQQIQQGLDAAKAALGADLERDLVEQLAGEFAEILLPMPPAEEGALSWTGFGLSSMILGLSGVPGSSHGSAVIVGLRETKPVEELFDQMVEVAGTGDWIEDEQVGERWMTTLAPPEVPLRPSWAFVDGALIVSLQAEPVRAVLAQAAEGAAPSWLEVEGHRASLAEPDAAFLSSRADLARWLQAEVAAPVAWLARALESDFAGEDPEVEEVVAQLAHSLPGLIDEHLRGTMRSAAWIEGDSLRLRFWSR
jgi:hypothetical protein